MNKHLHIQNKVLPLIQQKTNNLNIKHMKKLNSEYQISVSEVRNLASHGKISWKDNSPRSMGGNISYRIKENEDGKALFILSCDPKQTYHFCGKINQ